MLDKAVKLLPKITSVEKTKLLNLLGKMYEKEEKYLEAEKAYEQCGDW